MKITRLISRHIHRTSVFILALDVAIFAMPGLHGASHSGDFTQSQVDPPVAQGSHDDQASILEIQMFPGLRLQGEVDYQYEIQATINPESGPWEELGKLWLDQQNQVWVDSDPDPNHKFYRAVRLEEFVVPGIELAMVRIPAGSFIMGSPDDEVDRGRDEGPLTEVTISRPFWIGKYEVTQGEWDEVMDSNPSQWKDNPELPVERVTWSEAMEFCEKLTQREKSAGRLPEGYEFNLPTEAQWEYACRAGTATRFYFGDDDSLSLLGDYAWYSINSGNRSHAVGMKLPNEWGLHDMHGNMFEWCRDWITNTYPGVSVTDPSGEISGVFRAIRGGSWNFDATFSRSANRGRNDPQSRRNFIGFRMALVPVPNS